MLGAARWLSFRVVVAAAAVAASGASCPFAFQPCRLPSSAGMPEILAAINRNSDLVNSLMSRNVSVSGRARGQYFLLDAKMAMEKSRRFRLVGRSGFGEEVDVGSNDEQFWFWVARNTPPALYYCRHEDYARLGPRQGLAFDPNWIVEALGIEALDPGDEHEGPFPRGGGRLELRTRRHSPQGETTTKVIVVDACQGVIVEQHLYDAAGRHLAGAALSDHRTDSSVGAVLPRKIVLTWPEASLTLTLVLRDLSLEPVAESLWVRPSKPQEIDLSQPGPAITADGPSGDFLPFAPAAEAAGS